VAGRKGKGKQGTEGERRKTAIGARREKRERRGKKDGESRKRIREKIGG
jgi:hypothetical protein